MEGYSVKQCPKCVNSCPLDKPKCVTGRKLAEQGNIYEPIPRKESFFEILREKLKKERW